MGTSNRDGNPLCLQALVPVIVARSLADRAVLVRRRLRAKSNILVIGGGSVSLDELLREAARIGPAVLVIADPDVEELETLNLPEAVDFGRTVRILVVGRADDERERGFILLGCMGLVSASASPALLAKAIRALTRGEMWFSRRNLTSAFQELLQASRAQGLTSRESEILRMIAAGRNNRAIASELCISYDTVRWHIRRLNAKLKTTEPPVRGLDQPAFSSASKPPARQRANRADRRVTEFPPPAVRSGGA